MPPPAQRAAARVEQLASPDHPAAEVASGGSRFPAVLAAALAATLGLLVAGVLTAMAGVHHFFVQGPLAVGFFIFIFRQLPRHGVAGRLPRAVVILLLGLVVAVVVTNLVLRSNLVVAGRDGATYANTAAFLVDGADLHPTAVATPFGGEGFEYRAPGFVVRDDGTFFQQFLHSTPAMYAFFGELFGRGAIFAVNAVLAGIGLLAIFALALRFVSPWWALAAATLTAATLPYAYYARGTFSEIPALVLVIGGLWAGHIATTTRPEFSLGAGLLLGGAALVRVDAWMIGIALAAVHFIAVWLDEEEAAWAASRIFAGFAVAAAIGLIDLAVFSEPYLANVGRNLLALIVVAVSLRVAVPLAASAPLRRLAGWGQRHIVQVGGVVALGLGVFFLYAWFVRPLLPPSQAPGVYDVAEIQLREGSAVEPNRAYTELSVWWLSWYLGIPLLAMGLAGFVAGLRRSLRKGEAGLRLVLVAFAVPTLTYIVRPSVNPDQIWAIRRFLPISIPGLVIMAVAVMAAIAARLPTAGSSRPLGAAVGVVAVAPLLLTSLPLIGTSDRAGVESQFAELCAGLGDSASVLLIDDDPEVPITWLLGPPLRSWCGVSVAGVAPGAPVTVEVDAVVATDPALLPDTPDLAHELAADAWEARLTAAPGARIRRSVNVFVDLTNR